MPAHVELFNKIGEVEGVIFEPPTPPATAERACIIPLSGLKLRKLDSDEQRYDPLGRYREAKVVLPNWRADGLTEFFGFSAYEDFEPKEGTGGSLGYQLSNDGGTTWLVWSDALSAWVSAVGPLQNTFNDMATVDKRIPLFPFGTTRQIRVKVRLVPGQNGQRTPILRNMRVFGEVEIDLWEDMTRSLKRYVEQALRFRSFYIKEVSAPGTDVILVDGDQGVGVNDPVEVYNLSTDPGRLQNLFQSRVGNTVRTSSVQIGTLEVQFPGSAECYIGAEDFLQISKIPSVVARVDSLEHVYEVWSDMPEADVSYARYMARRRKRREFFRASVILRSQSSLKRESLQMADALHGILCRGKCFPSISLGECYCVFESVRLAATDQIPQGLFVNDLNISVFGRTWTNQAEDVGLVRIVRVLVGSDLFPNNRFREILDIGAQQ